MNGLHPDTFERIARAVELVHERLSRSTGALEQAGIPYAVAGGSAVKAWVARVDESAVRQTPDVDIVVSRGDYERAKMALERAGFLHRPSQRGELFVEGEEAPDRKAVRVYKGGERVREGDALPIPGVDESEPGREFRILSLEALVRMELTAFRTVNAVHLRDLIDVGLVDPSWVARLPGPLDDRLQHLLDTPDG